MATKPLGAIVALGVASAYAAPLVLWLGMKKDVAEVQELMTPWTALEGFKKGNLLGDLNSWGTLVGGCLLLYNFLYVMTLHSNLPTTQMRVTGLMRILVGAALLYAHYVLKAPNMNILLAANDISTGLLSIIFPSSIMSLIPNAFLTAGLGAGVLLPDLRAELTRLFAKLATTLPFEGVDPVVPDLPTLFVLGVFIMATYATLPLVGALTMNTPCLRATGNAAAYAVLIFFAAGAHKLIDQEVAMVYAGAHAIAAVLLLLFVPEEAPLVTEKEKTN
ncbi:Hypothetical Protein FCC1311_050922 [Hondaea fermentalgiana]|uniref:Uncharacterized protein n=1 Tax=Hondaea fermentalgiana TaxID=2315210 RepID=A0A2R5GKR7_9STRA|nr:Hypothetical Protein FCC1311_050922 [Hondaea fermentalgiana]|eukprot:GBG28871.1 Hypothetical Protein FCC1311_050922 [Hondaea fermentalgiana]